MHFEEDGKAYIGKVLIQAGRGQKPQLNTPIKVVEHPYNLQLDIEISKLQGKANLSIEGQYWDTFNITFSSAEQVAKEITKLFQTEEIIYLISFDSEIASFIRPASDQIKFIQEHHLEPFLKKR